MKDKLWVLMFWIGQWCERIRAYVANEEPYPVIDLRYLRFLEAEQRKIDRLDLRKSRILDNGCSACLTAEDRDEVRFIGVCNSSGLLAYVDGRIHVIVGTKND